MQVLFPVAFISSSGSQILGAQIVRINEGGDKLVISTTRSNFSLSHLPVLVIDTSISFPLPLPPPPPPHFYCFFPLPPTHCGHYIYPTSKPHRLYMDQTSTPHRPYFNQTSSLYGPHLVPTSALQRPHIHLLFQHRFVNSEAIYHYHHISFVPPPPPPPVIAEILEVANNPNLNKNRGSTVRGDR